jgi:hypothetical protein
MPLTIYGGGHLVVDGSHLAVDGGQLAVNGGHLVVDSGHLVVDGGHLVVDDVGEPQDLGSCHTSLFLRQRVQSLQSIFHLFLSNKLLQIFF